jgi:PAS domain S-box-containing protein
MPETTGDKPSKPLHILIADDDDNDRKRVKIALKQAGLPCLCTEASSIEDALEACQYRAFDCALIDYRLTGQDGLAGIAALLQRLPYLAIIMITGHGDETVAVEAMKRGALDYIPKKNIDAQSIKHSISNAVAKANLLKEREHTIRALLDSAGEAILAVNQHGQIVLMNPMAGVMFGYPDVDLLGQSLQLLVPPEARQRHACNPAAYFDQPSARLMGRGVELSGLRRDGSVFPIEVSLSFIETAVEKLAVAFVTDISQRKQMEREAHAHSKQIGDLAARLLAAQEDERRRVSRDLHDQVCQQLAYLAIGIGGHAAALSHSPEQHTQLKALQTRAILTGELVRHIAHDLHPQILDDLGVVASLQGLCEEFSAQEGVAVEFTHGPLPTSIPRELSSCFYRVAQQTLQNVAQHAEATKVSVSLTFSRNALFLSVRDNGVGFDPAKVRGRGSLGLTNMEERARLVNGSFSLISAPGQGTQIVVEIPLASP